MSEGRPETSLRCLRSGVRVPREPQLLLLPAGFRRWSGFVNFTPIGGNNPRVGGSGGGGDGGTVVVVAMRYLIPEGTSHSHLYLYRRDGSLIRQLTKAETGQDADPVFSPDGKSVVYARTDGEANEWRQVSVDGKNDHLLKTPPSWHEGQSQPAPVFTSPEARPGSSTLDPYAKAGDIPLPMKDGTATLTLKDDPARREVEDAGWFPKVPWFRAQADEPELNVAAFPFLRPRRGEGQQMFWTGPLQAGLVPSELYREEDPESPEINMQYVMFAPNSPFMECPPLKVAVFSQHIGSTDGSRVIAVDLRSRKLFELTPNGGPVVVLEGRSEFGCVCAQRYLPLGDGRTVNCSYLDLWDSEEAGLRRTRFAEARTGKFYGASIRLAGKDAAAHFHIPSSLGW